MLLPADILLRALTTEVAHLGANTVGGPAVASAQQSVDAALRLLLAREEQGGDAVRAQCAALLAVLRSLVEECPAAESTRSGLEALIAELQETAVLTDLSVLEGFWRAFLSRLETWSGDREGARAPLWSARVTAALTEWEAGDLSAQLGGAAPSAAVDTSLDAAKLESYLRDRFADATIDVPQFKQLAGGFGKQTYVFEATGDKFGGAFVVRRDLPVAVLENDCHRIEIEYAVIRAVHAQGFPAPEAVWLDTAHSLLPGGHFLMMRRAPGAPGGSVFTAQGGVPPDLSQTLAVILARLHGLPPLEELGELNESIHTKAWNSSLVTCSRQYLENWRDMFERDVHLPSPAIAGLFNWLLSNLPETATRPVLLHGDIGFHNFLFDGDRLTAVLDWEFAHLGDPAEDLAYVRNTLGASINWPEFLTAYRAAGGHEVSAERIRFYQVWGHLRNAASSSIIAGKFAQGMIADLKMVQLPHLYIPLFLTAAEAAIQSTPG